MLYCYLYFSKRSEYFFHPRHLLNVMLLPSFIASLVNPDGQIKDGLLAATIYSLITDQSDVSHFKATVSVQHVTHVQRRMIHCGKHTHGGAQTSTAGFLW